MLGKILDKLGLKDPSQLKPEEKAIWDRWIEVTNRPNFSIEDLKELLKNESRRVMPMLRDPEMAGTNKGIYFQAYASFLHFLEAHISGAEREKEALKVELEKRFNL